MTPLERFIARLGIAPFDPGNALHADLFDALKDAAGESHMERLIITRGVLGRAHAAAATTVGTARSKYETTLKERKRAEVEAGRSVSAATVIADADAQPHRNRMHEAEAAWRGVKEHLRTVDKDIDKTRSDAVDARQMRTAETYGGGA
ncbi:hypothetical protein [Microbacterium sp. 5K110]|jgi:hypothetical protein|uniref:hypothetical protein n=1 Tax=Microbacterium sp. 5K110 TaxID=2578104 RepID=UPI0010FF2987|nr:hypothetical protein [Microbacterium sp. 5K110]TLF33261.1 hypothetical protein FE256_03980 [Microbacterium sp. 5K110]